MRTYLTVLVLATVSAIAPGCASDKASEPAASSKASTAAAQGMKACTMQADGHDVLRLTVSADTACTPRDGSIQMVSQNRYVNIWLARGAKTVDEAVGRVAQEISSEFKDFSTMSTTPMTVAGTPAKQLMGSGTEADDGDPGHADVVAFKLGDHVFIACTHGESLTTTAQQWMMTVLQTAKKP